MSKSKPKRISITEFTKRFSTEDDCRNYLVKVRWPEGFICPECGSQRHCVLSNGLYQCDECHRQTSVTAGTFMHRSHLKLKTWFYALYFVTQDKRGISATQLASDLGINYKSAWRMLKKIRAAMGQRDESHMLSGIVEFDDAYIGGPTVGKKRGRRTEKAKIFVALSLKNGGPEYLKMKATENIRKESVKSFAEKSIMAGATVKTDACRSYIPALKEYDINTRSLIPIPGIFSGSTRSSATPRRLFWEPITACPRRIFSLTWTSAAIALVDAGLVVRSLTVWLWP